MSVLNDYALNRADRERNNKVQGLKNDLRTTRGLRNIELIPVTVGATGLVKISQQQHLQSIKGSLDLEEVQIAAIKGTIKIQRNYILIILKTILHSLVPGRGTGSSVYSILGI